jgi:hypothetical protein
MNSSCPVVDKEGKFRLRFLILAATVALMVSLAACEKHFENTVESNAISAAVQNRAEARLAIKLIDFVNGAEAPSDLKKFKAIGESNGHDEAWLFIHAYDTYTSHIKDYESEDEPEEHEVKIQFPKTLSNGITATYKEEEDDFPSLSWEQNHYFYDTSIKDPGPGQNYEQILTRMAVSTKKQQIIDKTTELKKISHFHYPKLSDRVKRISVGIENDEENTSDDHYTLFYMNNKGENIFWIQINKHSNDFAPKDSEKFKLKNREIAYYYDYPGDRGIGEMAVTIDGYDYYIEANASQIKTKNEVLAIANSLIN